MQFMLIRTDNDARAAAADPQAVLDDLLRRLPSGQPATGEAPRPPALALPSSRMPKRGA
jgi:hypothetical protein